MQTASRDLAIERIKERFVTVAIRARGADAVRQALTFHDAVRIARGCTDYGGGHHYDGKMDAYQHGIQTVIAALEHVEREGLNDLQSKTLHSIGAAALRAEGEKGE